MVRISSISRQPNIYLSEATYACNSELENVPAAAMDSGPSIADSSSLETKDGCAVNPASSFPSFKNRHTYYRNNVRITRFILKAIQSFSYLSTEAIPNTPKLLNSMFLSQHLDSRLNDGVDSIGAMLCKPRLTIKSRIWLEHSRLETVTTEKVWNHREIALGRHVISKELGIDANAHDI